VGASKVNTLIGGGGQGGGLGGRGRIGGGGGGGGGGDGGGGSRVVEGGRWGGHRRHIRQITCAYIKRLRAKVSFYHVTTPFCALPPSESALMGAATMATATVGAGAAAVTSATAAARAGEWPRASPKMVGGERGRRPRGRGRRRRGRRRRGRGLGRRM